MDKLILKAFGKINLMLDITGRREDGYHLLKSIMHTVELCDTVTIERNDTGLVRVFSDNEQTGPMEDNIAYKAAMLIKETCGISDGLDIRLYKKIPIAAGMAGGSADCAAVLKGLDRMYGLKLGPRLYELGLKLGADVPFCIKNGCELCEGIGEIMTEAPYLPDCYIVVAKPPVSVSTKDVYREIDKREIIKHPDPEKMKKALIAGDLKAICGQMYNVLEEVTADKHPVIREIEEMMDQSRAVKSIMTGSGPTVTGIFDDPEAAEQAAGKIKASGKAECVYITEPYRPEREYS
ncbi:MAG: 4-(cytidine 5'-diphospho)-2-C-methyl-D-erythritol kinase [Lachnospiraceae bacterium]|nr:4-(cytidine 5'-diphospho)-2-C-methyl-D-erythritol kinase [Lachnospiraceae bacterium]